MNNSYSLFGYLSKPCLGNRGRELMITKTTMGGHHETLKINVHFDNCINTKP